MPTAARTSLAILESPSEQRLRAWVELAATYTRVLKRVTALLQRQQMTLAQFDVMATLRFSDGVTQQELAKRLLVTKGNVVGLLDRLAESGYVIRKADTQDGRTNRLHLTSAGRRKIERLLPAHDRLIEEVFGDVSPADLKHLRRTMVLLGSEQSG